MIVELIRLCYVFVRRLLGLGAFSSVLSVAGSNGINYPAIINSEQL